MGSSRHQEKSAAGKNKRLMRSYYFQGFFCFFGWLVFVLVGFFGGFFLKKTKSITTNKILQMVQSSKVHRVILIRIWKAAGQCACL